VSSVFGYLIGGYVVRHHAAEYVDSGFSFIPVITWLFMQSTSCG
jgi:hypothetical protein